MTDQNFKSCTYIVTVNYKSEQVLVNFLKSINNLRHSESILKIIIIDSSGELNPISVSSISNHQVELIRLPLNQGFAYAANIGLRTCLQRSKVDKINSYAWLLNPDTLVHPEALASLIENISPQIILGSAVTNDGFTPDSTIWGAGGTIDRSLNVDMQYHSEPLRNIPTTPYEFDYIPGCSMFIPLQILEKHGFMPEEFFLYFEETDWCLKLKKEGIKLKIVPQSLIQHISETGKMDAPYRVYFYNRNQIYFKFKNLGQSSDKLKLLLKTISKIPKLLYLVAKEKDLNLKNTFLAHLLANFDVLRMLLIYATNYNPWKNISLSRLKLLKNRH